MTFYVPSASPTSMEENWWGARSVWEERSDFWGRVLRRQFWDRQQPKLDLKNELALPRMNTHLATNNVASAEVLCLRSKITASRGLSNKVCKGRSATCTTQKGSIESPQTHCRNQDARKKISGSCLLKSHLGNRRAPVSRPVNNGTCPIV